MVTAVVHHRQLQVELLKHPLFGSEVPTGIQAFNETIQLGDLLRFLQINVRRRQLAEPDQLPRAGLQLVVVLGQAAITAKGHDGVQLTLNSQNIALVFGADLTPNRSQGGKVIKMSLHRPLLWSSKDTEFLEGNRLEAVDHLPPLGSNGRRDSLLPAEVAVTVTACWAIC